MPGSIPTPQLSSTSEGARIFYHLLPSSEVIRMLDTSSSMGLSTSQVAIRLQKHGPNLLSDPMEGLTMAKVAWKECREPPIMLLFLVGVLYSIWGKCRIRSIVDAITIIITILIVVLVEVRTEWQAKQSIKSLSRRIAYNVAVRRDDSEQVISSEQLVEGDILFVSRGQMVPCDARVLSTLDLKVDESVLTGESEPVSKTVEVDSGSDDAYSGCMVYAGTLISSGRGMYSVIRITLSFDAFDGTGKLVVTATGKSTSIAQVRDLIKMAKEPKTPLQKLMQKLAGALTIVALMLAVIIPVIGFLRGLSYDMAILTGISLAFATMPEELPLIVKAVLAISALKLSKSHILIRHLKAAEALGAVTIIVSDKTGTLTSNKLSVKEAVMLKAKSDPDVVSSQCKYIDLNDLAAVGGHPLPLLQAWALSTDIGLERDTEDGEEGGFVPILESEQDVFDAAVQSLFQPPQQVSSKAFRKLATSYPKLSREVPFDSVNRVSARVRTASDGTEIMVLKGAPEAVLAFCTRIFVLDETEPSTGNLTEILGRADPLTQSAATSLVDSLAYSATRGRLLCYALRVMPPSQPSSSSTTTPLFPSFTFIGGFIFHDPVRREVPAAISDCHAAGIRVVMCTGDHAESARRVAHEVGIMKGGGLVIGKDVEQIEEAKFAQTVEAVDVIARVTPQHKFRIIKALQARGHVVAMIGDGVNDGPALASADIGIAIAGGVHRTDVAMESASLIMLDPNFEGLVEALMEGRRISDNVRKTVTFYLACKLALTSLFIFLLFLPLDPVTRLPHLPLSPLHVILLEVFMDLGAAAAFTVESGEASIATRPPSSIGSAFDRTFVSGVIRNGAFLFVAVAVAWGVGWRMGGRNGRDGVEQENVARTFAFLEWMIAHVVLAGVLRTSNVPQRVHGLFSNKAYAIWAGCVVVFCGVCLVPPVAERFKLVGYDGIGWAGLGIVIALGVVGVGGMMEGWKEIRWGLRARYFGLHDEEEGE